MLTKVAGGVWVHQSPLIQNNSIVVVGADGVLLVDPGITESEMICLASDMLELGQPVVAAFATHPDWDHALWHVQFGDAPRYGTAQCAEFLHDFRSKPDWREQYVEGLPSEIADVTPIELFGLITGLSTARIPWDGPEVRVIAHPAHAQGHAALLLEESRVLIAGDMLSDILPPFIDAGAEDPLGDYLEGLRVLESVADEVDVLIPGHGSAGRDMRARIDLDRAYVLAVRDDKDFDDPRLGPSATYGQEWLPGMFESDRERFGRNR